MTQAGKGINSDGEMGKGESRNGDLGNGELEKGGDRTRRDRQTQYRSSSSYLILPPIFSPTQ